MDFMFDFSADDIAFIVVFYIYVLCAVVVSYILLKIWEKFNG